MPDHPLPVSHFQVDWGGTRIGFTEVTGLNIEVQVIEYREGSMPDTTPMKMPGLKIYGNITLKRGVFAGDNEFFEWFNTIVLNKVERRDITISLLDENHQPVVIWTLKNAWPTKVQSTDLKSDGNEVAIESVEVAHEGLTIRND